MAGVRDYSVTPIAEPKGVPGDMSTPTRLAYEREGVDAHTASWFHESEIDELVAWWEKQMHESEISFEWSVLNKMFLFGSSLTAFKHYDDCQYVPDGVDAVRIVFWFDN